MSPTATGLVETSNNIGTARTDGEDIRIGCLIRSSRRSAMTAVAATLGSAARASGAAVEWVLGYPGWEPNPDSPLLRIASTAFRRAFGHEPRLTAVHAGLECGIIGERVGGMDMSAFGPNIKGPHAPGERVHVGSVERFWHLLAAILEDLACRGIRGRANENEPAALIMPTPL